MVLGPLQQQLFQLGQLFVAEAWFGTGVRFGTEPSLAAGQPTPAVDGGLLDAENARYG